MSLKKRLKYVCLIAVIGAFISFISFTVRPSAHSLVPSTPMETPTPTPEDPEITIRKNEAAAKKAEAEAKKAEADAKKSQADARKQEIENRNSELNLLKGTTTVTGDLIENDILAYQAVSCAVPSIQRSLFRNRSEILALMIYNTATADAMTEYSALIFHLNDLDKKYDASFIKADNSLKPYLSKPESLSELNTIPSLAGITPEIIAAAGISTLINSFISPAIDVLSLFKVEEKITGENVVIGQDEFIAKVINGSPVPVYYPEKVLISKPPTNSNLLTKLNSLLTKQSKARILLKVISDQRALLAKGNKESLTKDVESKKKAIADLEAKLVKASSKDKPKIQTALNGAKAALESSEAALKNEVKRTEELVSKFDTDLSEITKQLTNLNSLVDTVINQFSPAQKDGETSVKGRTLASYLRAETIVQKITDLEVEAIGSGTKADGKTAESKRIYWLDVKVAKAGGSTREKGSPVTDIFTRGKKITFSGGAVVTFKIFDSESLVLASDTILAYVPYRKLNDKANLICSDSFFIP